MATTERTGTAVEQAGELADQLVHNAYLTDGRSLFRCLGGPGGLAVMLEDCLTLELTLCRLEDLARSGACLVKRGKPLSDDSERPSAVAVMT